MSARLICVLRCDHNGCDERYVWSDTGTSFKPPRLHLARRAAIAEGWRHGVRRRLDSGPAPTFDFCPRHADVLEPANVMEVRP